MKQATLNSLQTAAKKINTIDTHSALLEAAPYRKIIPPDNFQPKQSAVLIPLVWHKNQWQILMIVRPKYDGHHSGQVAFPGGKAEPCDKSLQETALRETHEEVGLLPEKINVLFKQSEIYIPVSNYLVHPYVGTYDNLQINDLQLDPLEVEDVLFIPFNKLKNETLIRHRVKTSSGVYMTVPAYRFQNQIIWGASCIMLNELKFLTT